MTDEEIKFLKLCLEKRAADVYPNKDTDPVEKALYTSYVLAAHDAGVFIKVMRENAR